jgi:hypothetical protein
MYAQNKPAGTNLLLFEIVENFEKCVHTMQKQCVLDIEVKLAYYYCSAFVL